MDEKRFTLRMDGSLFEDICLLAKKHRRSTAKEIEYAIAKYVLAEKRAEIMKNEDIDNLSGDDARAQIRSILNLYEKYDIYLKEDE